LLRFERLISNLSARFVNILPEQVDAEIEWGLQQLLEFFQIDRCGLLLAAPDSTTFQITHACVAEGIPPVPVGEDLSTALFPWAYQKVIIQHEVVSVAMLDEMPPEASVDTQTYREWGIRSHLNIPIVMTGSQDYIISINAVRSERAWPEEYIPRLRLLGEIFVNALERQRAEGMLRESEARFRQMADATPVMIWMSGSDKGCTYLNEGWLDFTGRTMEQELGNGWAEGVHPDDLQRCLDTYVRAFDAREKFSMEYRLRRCDGEYRWIWDIGVPRFTTGGRFEGYIGSCIDITERKRSVETLRRSEDRFRLLSETTRAVAWEADARTWQFTYVGPQAANLLGYPSDEWYKADFWVTHLHPDDRESAVSFCLKSSQSATDYEFEYRMVSAGGQTVWIHDIVSVEKAEGEPRTLRGFMIDITERKQMERQLEARLREIEELKERLERENIYLREEVKLQYGPEDVVGQSDAMRRILAQAEQVAQTDSTVLILGETGTGKQLLARTIHNLSARKARAPVTVNCASLPPTLIESELFGREKGAYTGALTRMVGRFEAADGSTLFLDEIGELPLEVQAKLLRVLQDGQFERLGSTKTVHVNVRLIAATNRDLAQDIQEGKFRKDLFYRLNVFPIVIPPLRERPEDIPVLVWTFVREFEKKMGKRIESIQKRSMEALQRYRWPGNARELRNVIEHAMIVSGGRTLEVRIPTLYLTKSSIEMPVTGSLEDIERNHILDVLKMTGWRIMGKGGAAEVLGLKRTTLQSRMSKLGIKRPTPNSASRE